MKIPIVKNKLLIYRVIFYLSRYILTFSEGGVNCSNEEFNLFAWSGCWLFLPFYDTLNPIG